MIWANANSIWLSKPTTLTRHTKSTRKWDASALKITKWGFISSKTPTAIGLKFYRNSYIKIKVQSNNSAPF